jgi:hypothetical protein
VLIVDTAVEGRDKVAVQQASQVPQTNVISVHVATGSRREQFIPGSVPPKTKPVVVDVARNQSDIDDQHNTV